MSDLLSRRPPRAHVGWLAQPGYWLKSIHYYGPFPYPHFSARTYYPVSRSR